MADDGRYVGTPMPEEVERLIAEARADERKQAIAEVQEKHRYEDARLLADLRTQVEDLFVLSLFSGDYVNRAEVLALFDGHD